jgi:hypothetical protein
MADQTDQADGRIGRNWDHAGIRFRGISTLGLKPQLRGASLSNWFSWALVVAWFRGFHKKNEKVEARRPSGIPDCRDPSDPSDPLSESLQFRPSMKHRRRTPR